MLPTGSVAAAPKAPSVNLAVFSGRRPRRTGAGCPRALFQILSSFFSLLLLSRLAQKTINPKQLTSHQRKICIRWLLSDKKHTTVEIGAILGVTQGYVSQIKRQIMNQNAWMLDDLDERKWAIELVQSAMTASARLFRQGKNREAFQVEKEAIEVLQSLGFLKRKPIQIDANLTLQEILKLAVTDGKDEAGFLGSAGVGAREVLTNGSH